MAKKIHYVPRYARDDLKDGEKKIEAFLTHLAVKKMCLHQPRTRP